MRAMLALVRREAIEHRGAFLFAPAVLLALFAIASTTALGFNKLRVPLTVSSAQSLGFFEIAFLAMAFLWFVYLMVALFFYFADAFNADRRNNAMLFWKSMPQSDFKILASKLLSALTILPAQIFGLLIATGIVLYVVTALATVVIPGLTVPGPDEVLASSGKVLWFCLAYAVLALLWYAPFFAWVGMLSSVVGRWSIPLAFLVPGLVVLGENLYMRGVADYFAPADGMRGGVVLNYLRERSSFAIDNGDTFEHAFRSGVGIDLVGLLDRFVAEIDWTQMAGGLVVAALLVYAASEYRRRFIVA